MGTKRVAGGGERWRRRGREKEEEEEEVPSTQDSHNSHSTVFILHFFMKEYFSVCKVTDELI